MSSKTVNSLVMNFLNNHLLYLNNTDIHLGCRHHDNVYYIPVVLKSSGLVDGVIEGTLDEEVLKTADSFANWNIYLCGDPQMIKKIQKQIFLKGASLKTIHADAFIPYA